MSQLKHVLIKLGPIPQTEHSSKKLPFQQVRLLDSKKEPEKKKKRFFTIKNAAGCETCTRITDTVSANGKHVLIDPNCLIRFLCAFKIN